MKYLIAIVFVSFFSQLTLAQDASFQFQGRTMNLEPYLKGFQYRGHIFDVNNNRVVMRVVKEEIDTLYHYEYQPGQAWAMENIKPLILTNVARRNIWAMKFSSKTNKYYLMMDEKNDEIINVYSVDPVTLKEKRLTNFAYVYGIALSPDSSTLAATVRMNGPEGTDGAIVLIDLKTDVLRTIYRDTPQSRIYFGDISWSPDGKRIVFVDTVENNRSYINLSAIQTTVPYALTRITDRSIVRTSVANTAAWIGSHQIYFSVLEKNYLDILKYDFTQDLLETVPMNAAISKLAILQSGSSVQFIVRSGPPYFTQFDRYSVSGELLGTWKFQGSAVFSNNIGDEIFFSANSPSQPTELHSFYEARKDAPPVSVFEYSKEQRDATVHCDFEKVGYRTFDGYAASGEGGLIHALLIKPKNPLPKDKQILMVEAFYGGKASYSLDYSLFCQAGIYVLSPAPRGSPDWPKDFVTAIEGDLGGNEIIDVIEAAKWGEMHLQIPRERIGSFGFSHGGYAVMRQLTFPGIVNDHKEDFKWGFGIAGAGISNIVRYHNTGNIPGWVRRMCGEDPNRNPEKWNSRSPDQLASSVHGPILLQHGENDMRVPVEESRSMARALAAQGKTYEYIEYAGEGHGMKLYQNKIRYYRSQFDFISNHVLK